MQLLEYVDQLKAIHRPESHWQQGVSNYERGHDLKTSIPSEDRSHTNGMLIPEGRPTPWIFVSLHVRGKYVPQ